MHTINIFMRGRVVMRQRKYARILSLVLAISLIAGTIAGVAIAIPLMLPFLLAAGVAGYLLWRFRRGGRGGLGKRGKQ